MNYVIEMIILMKKDVEVKWPATAHTSAGFIEYLNLLSQIHNELYVRFNFHCRHREMLMWYFGARRSALENLANRALLHLMTRFSSIIQRNNERITEEVTVVCVADNLDIYLPLLLLLPTVMEGLFVQFLQEELWLCSSMSSVQVSCVQFIMKEQFLCDIKAKEIMNEIFSFVEFIPNNKYDKFHRIGEKAERFCGVPMMRETL
ncbi:hypothetical protein BDA99DRAFT_575238 [Phascolomyces articulosus]|uniref:Uncharacterized protein n=1 Tax=Phascolomyces articulosus TaxID=60185 RepID=A0AAD5JRY6_9FUNG|nr:hypothetical protein BDA99DRAFT_575238 [Phascolomyces articulosus]